MRCDVSSDVESPPFHGLPTPSVYTVILGGEGCGTFRMEILQRPLRWLIFWQRPVCRREQGVEWGRHFSLIVSKIYWGPKGGICTCFYLCISRTYIPLYIFAEGLGGLWPFILFFTKRRSFSISFSYTAHFTLHTAYGCTQHTHTHTWHNYLLELGLISFRNIYVSILFFFSR